MVEVLEEYPWSSQPGYLSRAKKWDWLHKDFILSLLTENKDKKRVYRQFIRNEEPEEIIAIFAKKKLPSLLGSEQFLSWVKETFFLRKKDREIPDSLLLAPTREQIFDATCRIYGVEADHLLTVRRGRKNESRNVAIYLCRILRNDTLSDIGKVFGMTGYSPAGSAVERVNIELKSDRELEKKIEEIKKICLQKKGQGETWPHCLQKKGQGETWPHCLYDPTAYTAYTAYLVVYIYCKNTEEDGVAWTDLWWTLWNFGN